RLESPVAALLGGAACRIALDDEELGCLGVVDRAVGELPGKRHPVERRLASRQLTGLARGLARAGGSDRLVHDLARVGRVLLQELREAGVDRRLDEARNLWVPELRLGLALELGIRELHRDDRGKPLADVLALEVVLLLLE